MAEVSSSGIYDPSRISTSYLPSLPIKPPKATLAYSRAVQDAPFSALMGVVVDAKIPERHPITPRCRVRHQVGMTNRWRLPESLGSDLLGSAQAIKAVTTPYNQTLVSIITAESPQMSMNVDTSKPYTFRMMEDRPYTQPIRQAVPRLSEDHAGLGRAAASAPIKLQGHKPMEPLRTFVPSTARPATPKDIFLYHSKRGKNIVGPDVILKCLNMDWELHRPFLRKSETLTNLLRGADSPRPQKYYRSKASETLDSYIKKSNFYSNEYQEISNRLSLVEGVEGADVEVKGLDHPAHTSEERVNDVSIIHLEVTDPSITKTAMAIALGNLYHDDIDVSLEEVSNVLAAGSLLGFKALVEGCGKLMMKNITHRTICKYHRVALKYQQEHVVLACERWLELHLIPHLSTQIQLREMPMNLLQKILKSNRLFLLNEYSVYKTLAYWLFMQLNPSLQLMPTHSTVLSYFNSLPKSMSFVERDDGQIYAPLFATVRLHGIIDTGHIQDMQIMNILPQTKLIDLLSSHYHALQGGGDMCALKNFNTGAIRQGFIIDDEPLYHSEVLSLHGFHFEVKAVGGRDGVYSFYMQRLKPGDPILSFRQCERQTFSMRPDREVRYSITVQYVDDNNENQISTTGILSQKFGLGDKISRSQVLKLEKLNKPIFVTFSILFPSS